MTNRIQQVTVCDFHSSVKKDKRQAMSWSLGSLVLGGGCEDMQLCGEELRPSANCQQHFLAT